ncbi:translation initiation factor IF-2 [Aureococcus anophagefferens]|nr:translation initiation factor IF-2 [Aureococcus anophagefferens]
MGDEESNYKVEYLDLPEDSTEEKEFVWVARAGKARVTYNSGSVYEGDFNDEKMKHGTGKFVWMTQGEEDEAQALATYEGEYADGKRSGGAFTSGEWQFKDAGNYQGTFEGGQPIGAGKFNFADTSYATHAINGSVVGSVVGLAVGADRARSSGLWGFNSALTALSVAVFFEPSRASYALAGAGAASTAFFGGLKAARRLHARAHAALLRRRRDATRTAALGETGALRLK